MRSMIIRQALSKSLYELFKEGEYKITVQVPFVDKEGNSLPDEDIEYSNIVDCTKALLEAGASPLFYITDNETFLLPSILSTLESGSAYSEDTKYQVIDILMNHISEKELQGLLPEHGNLLLKQMLFHEQLDRLLEKGLCFKQDLDNRYGNETEEILAIKRASINFFKNIAKNNILLDFDAVYNKDKYNETTLRKEVEGLKQKINSYKEESDLDVYKMYEKENHKQRKETLEFLEKWMLKNKFEKQAVKNDINKTGRNKI